MRLRITLRSTRPIRLPIHYNHLLQALIYSQLEPNLASWLHGEAYRYAKRSYKMFTFSRLEGYYQLDNAHKRITYPQGASFQLASINHDILASLAEHLLKSQNLRLGNNQTSINSVEILKPPELNHSKPIRVKTLSPITIHQTFERSDKKTVHYLDPQQKEWSEMLLANLERKANALGWHDTLEPEESFVRPQRVNNKDRKPMRYKNYVLIGWMGRYDIKLPEKYFNLAYDAGLGARNGQGFGMVEVMT